MVKMRNYDKSKVIGIRGVRIVTNMSHYLTLKNVHHV